MLQKVGESLSLCNYTQWMYSKVFEMLLEIKKRKTDKDFLYRLGLLEKFKDRYPTIKNFIFE